MSVELEPEAASSEFSALNQHTKEMDPAEMLGIDKTATFSFDKALVGGEREENSGEEKKDSSKDVGSFSSASNRSPVHVAPFSLEKMDSISHPSSKNTIDTIVEKVLEKTEVMLPSKNNSAVIDIKSADGEPIRLAVKIQDSKVEMKITSTSDKVLENLARDVDHLQNSLAERKLHLVDVKFSKDNPFSQNASTSMNFQDRGFSPHGAPFELEDWKQGMNSLTSRGISTSIRGWSRPNFIPAPTATAGQRVQVLI